MSIIRLLNNRTWSKPPVLTAARKVLMDGLARTWALRPLGELAEFVNGTSYDVGLLADQGTPIIRISNISDPRSRYIYTQEHFPDRFMVEPGNLLVSWSASFKSIIWPGPAGVLNQHIFRVSEKPGNHRGFIRHAIEAAFDEMQQKVVGIGMMHLRRGDFLGHLVAGPDLDTQRAVSRFLDWIVDAEGPEPPLPPELAEQRRIVARVEELAAKIEAARGLRREAVQAAQALWVGALREHFRINGLPMMTLESVCQAIIDNLHSTPTYDGDDFPCIRSQDVGWGTINYETALRTSEAEFVFRTQRGEPQRGDIVYVREGDIGRCAVVDGSQRFSLGQRVMMLRPNQRIVNSDFLLYQLVSPPVLDDQILSSKAGTTSHHVNIKHLRLVRVAVPPLHTQERQVAELRSIRARLDALERLQGKTAAELDALLPSVLDRAFSGGL